MWWHAQTCCWGCDIEGLSKWLIKHNVCNLDQHQTFVLPIFLATDPNLLNFRSPHQLVNQHFSRLRSVDTKCRFSLRSFWPLL